MRGSAGSSRQDSRLLRRRKHPVQCRSSRLAGQSVMRTTKERPRPHPAVLRQEGLRSQRALQLPQRRHGASTRSALSGRFCIAEGVTGHSTKRQFLPLETRRKGVSDQMRCPPPPTPLCRGRNQACSRISACRLHWRRQQQISWKGAVTWRRFGCGTLPRRRQRRAKVCKHHLQAKVGARPLSVAMGNGACSYGTGGLPGL
mmetsp:Transcript_26712/g.50196  ORF Transcript_26712/g.50196 Transcript_26712/m.50196 type:complete len:201 (+) Transcript_26712:157-759(+)